MTIENTPRYSNDRLPQVGDSAIVVGASMAGLLAGRVLADGFREVIVLDRDPLTTGSGARRGVPQANHVHAMLEPGKIILEDLFPGYGEELISEGGIVIDVATDFDYYHRGDFIVDGPNRLPMHCATRPLFEHITRRRLAERDDVTLRGECQLTDYVADESANRVEGVKIVDENDAERTLTADLVVDATGRTSRTPAWLERHHYAPPVEDEVTVDLAYSTITIERPSSARQAFLVAPSPPISRGGTVSPIEGNRWIVTLFGMHGDHPPTDPEGFMAFAESLPTPEIHQLLDTHAWCTDDIHHYPFPSSLRRRYEDLHRFPEGLVVTGDAIASFNPIYGQGMSVAALDALQLHHALAADGLDGFAPRFFDRTGDIVDTIWQMTVGADFEFDATQGRKPFGTDLLNAYVARLIETAHVNGQVADQFARVLRLEQPPKTLFAPRVAWAVLAPERMK